MRKAVWFICCFAELFPIFPPFLSAFPANEKKSLPSDGNQAFGLPRTTSYPIAFSGVCWSRLVVFIFWLTHQDASLKDTYRESIAAGGTYAHKNISLEWNRWQMAGVTVKLVERDGIVQGSSLFHMQIITTQQKALSTGKISTKLQWHCRPRISRQHLFPECYVRILLRTK